MPTLLQIRTGRVRRLGDHLTAYAKDPRDGPVAANRLGLEGDEVGNRRVHGGPDKAIYAYAAGNYPLWIADLPAHRERLIPGAFGENLLIEGLDEQSTCIGDQYRIGGAVVEICQPRQPCATLARWFDDPKIVKAMVRNGRAGWYLRVIEAGEMAAGAPVILLARPESAWSVAEVLAASYRTPPDRADLKRLAAAPGLASSWADWASRAATAERPGPKPL